MSEETKNQPDTEQSAVPEDVRNSPGKSKVKRAFIEWLTIPESLREPKTARQFAADNKVSERTLHRWKAQGDVQNRVQGLVNLHARSRYADVANAIVECAIAGDVSAQKLYLQKFIPESEVKPDGVEVTACFGDEGVVPWFAKRKNNTSQKSVSDLEIIN